MPSSLSALVNVLLPVVHPRMGTGFDAAGSSPLLEPPGFLLLNYGRQTPIVTVVAHIVYGAIVGGFASWAGTRRDGRARHTKSAGWARRSHRQTLPALVHL